ncbi:MAG TPA: hypothetical protein VFV43_06410, partial [Limnobacter sp.]|nr:hypothetical protein [Limnobacter sp.]
DTEQQAVADLASGAGDGNTHCRFGHGGHSKGLKIEGHSLAPNANALLTYVWFRRVCLSKVLYKI